MHSNSIHSSESDDGLNSSSPPSGSIHASHSSHSDQQLDSKSLSNDLSDSDASHHSDLSDSLLPFPTIQCSSTYTPHRLSQNEENLNEPASHTHAVKSQIKEDKDKKKHRQGSFPDLGLSPALCKALRIAGYNFPTPIQRKVIPNILSGEDVIAMARTGSGKTAAFLAPLIHRLTESKTQNITLNRGPRGLVIAPTRELILQSAQFFRKYTKFISNITCATVVGGSSVEAQFSMLTKNPHVLFATPGRLLQILSEMKSKYSLKSVEMLVLDEADRLFEGNLATDLKDILKAAGYAASRGADPVTGSAGGAGVSALRIGGKQLVMVSATMPSAMAEFIRCGMVPSKNIVSASNAASSLQDGALPTIIRLDVEKSLSELLACAYLWVRPELKIPALIFLLRILLGPMSKRSKYDQYLKSQNDIRVMIFTATKHHVDLLVMALQALSKSTEGTWGVIGIHGQMDQVGRINAVDDFRKSKAQILVVTDVAARGIDIPLLDIVINFDFPATPKLFIHRCGRVARAGRPGTAYSLISTDEVPFFLDTCLFLGRPVQNVYQTNGNDNGNRKSIDYIKNHAAQLDVSHYYGAFPPGPIEDEVETFRDLVSRNIEIESQLKSMQNAQKLYVKTRPSPSGQSVQRAKELLKSDSSSWEVHPWFRNDQRFESVVDKITSDAAMQLKSWRPKELSIQAGERMKFERKKLLETHEIVRKILDEQKNSDDSDGSDIYISSDQESSDSEQDKSKASKKTKSKKTKKKKPSQRSEIIARQKQQFFLGNGPRGNLDLSAGMKEKGLQIRSGGAMGGKEDKLEDMVMDLMGEDADEMRKKKQMMRWDRKRMKYVKTDEDPNDKRTKKNESGKRVRVGAGGYDPNAGELYKKWKRNTKEEIVESECYARGRGRKRGANQIVQKELKGTEEFIKNRRESNRKKGLSRPKKKAKRQEQFPGGTPRSGKIGKGAAFTRSRRVVR